MAAGPILAVIPARLGSTRLHRKPLHPIAGRPLIEWVWRRVRGFSALSDVVIATDSEEIAAACAAFGADVVMTSATHESGTERVAEVAALPRFADHAVILNVQGDEPFVTAAQVDGAVGAVRAGADVGTAAAPLVSAAELADPAVVKVVRAVDGLALYFSRAPIPFQRDADGAPAGPDSEWYLRHVGVYAYTPGALRRWVSLPPHPLERIERLEQLRALANGMRIGVALVSSAEGGVDTIADADRAERRIEEMLATTSLEREVSE